MEEPLEPPPAPRSPAADSPSPLALRALLAEAGYRVLCRHEGWSECLLVRDDERWLGRGETDDAALGDALRRAFPSRLAWGLLLEAAAGRRAGAGAVDHADSGRGADDDAPPPAGRRVVDLFAAEPDPDRAGGGAAFAAPPALPARHPSAAAPDRAVPLQPDAPAAARVAGPDRDDADHDDDDADDASAAAAAPGPPSPAPPPPPSPTPPPPPRRVPQRLEPMSSAEAERERGELWARLRTERDEVAAWSPQRQRLKILAWIAYARAVEEATANGPPGTSATARLANQLSVLAGLWWPGSVTALRVNALPLESAAELGCGADGAPGSWYEVACAADARLAQLEAQEEGEGADEHGWFDAWAIEPGPPDPAALLAEVRRLVVDWTGPLDQKPDMAPASRTTTRRGVGQLHVEVARKLRWMRGAVDAPALWGQCMGRMRFLADHAATSDAREELRRVLDPGLRPHGTWAAAHGHDPARKEERRRRRALLESCPREGTTPDHAALLVWVRSAVDCPELLPERIADLMRPFRDRVLSIPADSTFSTERGHRTRLVKVQKRLATAEGAAASQAEAIERELKATGPELDEPVTAAVATARDRMLAEVRLRTIDRSVLLVSNRADPQQDRALVEAFGFGRLDHEVATASRLASLAQRIRAGSYELVIAASGFQGHRTDEVLKPAADAAGVPYVRANKARPLACARALHRDLQGTSAPAAAPAAV